MAFSACIIAFNSRMLARKSMTNGLAPLFNAIRSMSSPRLFVGGLAYGTDDLSLREAFSGFGQVVDAKVVVDRDTGRSRGFGFVTFEDGEAASSALSGMDGQDLGGRNIRVSYALERQGGGGGYRGGNNGWRSDNGGF